MKSSPKLRTATKMKHTFHSQQDPLSGNYTEVAEE